MAASDAGTSAGGPSTGDVKRAFDFSASNFASIVTTLAYVDKTLMIREVFEAWSRRSYDNSSTIMITAPPRFGKSTNLDMIKRFYEIEVDERGNPKPVEETHNHQLFSDYNLEIWKDKGFCNEHFGRHPVVYIDFKPLGSVEDSEKILGTFKLIVENTLSEHRYISDYIPKYKAHSEIDKLANKFESLSLILNKRFRNDVFILIDNYDAFLNSPLTKNETQCEIMQSFVKSSISSLLHNLYNEDCRQYVAGVLLTGVIPLFCDARLSKYCIIERCHFLGSHRFTKYYGLMPDEVDTVLCKTIASVDERDEVRNTINNYCNAYETCNPEVRRMYSVWSVLQYVSTRTVQSCRSEQQGFIMELKKCFKIESIRQKFEELLLGNKFQLHIYNPMLINKFMNVYQMIENRTADAKELYVFVELLYHFGYLSVIDELYGIGGEVIVNIPSEIIKYELATDVFDKYTELVNNRNVTDILSVSDKFQPDATNLDEHLQSFREFLNNFLLKNHNLKRRHTLECLYLNLIRRATNDGDINCKLQTDGPVKVLLLRNQHQVIICVAYGENHSAKTTHSKVVNSGRIFDEFNDASDKVIIAISFKQEFAYSYNFRKGDIRKVKFLR